LSVLSTLGCVGGAGAQPVIESKISSANATEHELVIRALTNWPNGSFANRLLELAHHRNLRKPNNDEFASALNKVLVASKNEIVRDRAQRYKNG
jgi:hypothetical protein